MLIPGGICDSVGLRTIHENTYKVSAAKEAPAHRLSLRVPSDQVALPTAPATQNRPTPPLPGAGIRSTTCDSTIAPVKLFTVNTAGEAATMAWLTVRLICRVLSAPASEVLCL
jgi:hypothetical protein